MRCFPLHTFLPWVFAVVALVSSPPVRAQSSAIRPGSSARGTTRSNGSTSGSATSSLSSSSGPRQYRSNTLLGDAVISIDPETRSVIIVTDEDTHRELSKVIRELDRPKPQVLIKVVFLEVTYTKDSDIGLEGSYTFNMKNPIAAGTGSNNTTTTTNNVSGATTTNTVNTVNTPLNTLAQAAQGYGLSSAFGLAAETSGSFVRVVQDDWSATLRALQSRGKVEVLSRPSIMARNNQEAVIVVGQEVPFITNSRTTDLGATINTIQYDNVGIILRVTPFITSNNAVEMIIAPEISNLTSQTVAISSTASSPVIAKRSAETVVVTPNGSTAVIGGLMETQRISNVQKIPLLGDIPYLGNAFKRTIKSDVKRELMIFLTPTIVADPSGVGELAGQEIENTELVEKAFTAKEFEKFFDARKNNRESTPPLPYPLDKEAPESVPAAVTTTTTETSVTKKRMAATVAATPTPAPSGKSRKLR